MDQTYLEILAQNDREAREGFDENARDQLVEQNEYEDTVEPREHHHEELDDQDAFKKFGGSHQAASAAIPIVPKSDANKQSILHDKDVKTHVINIDSRFRDDPTQIATEFLYKFQRPMKNIVSARISSIEFPNTYYTFSANRGNTSFTVYAPENLLNSRTNNFKKYVVRIPDGNYDPNDLINVLNVILASSCPYAKITLEFNIHTGLITFSSLICNFRLDFEEGYNLSFLPRTFDRGLGYSLGFRVSNLLNINASSSITQYNETSSNNLSLPSSTLLPTLGSVCCYQGTAMVDTIDNNYIFITLDPDWKVVINQAPDRSQHFSFCKVIMTAPKGSVLYDNGANTLTKEYWFQQPSNIVSFPVRISDPYYQIINLNGMDFSFTLELKEILNASLYETMRTN